MRMPPALPLLDSAHMTGRKKNRIGVPAKGTGRDQWENGGLSGCGVYRRVLIKTP